MKIYHNPETFTVATRYKGKNVTVFKSYASDGASGGLDVCPKSYFVHDWLCGNYLGTGPKPPKGTFDDGTKCTNWQASTIHSDLLIDCSKNQRITRKIVLYGMAAWRWPATFLFGGGESRKNGMFTL